MSTIPASDIVSVNPSVLSAGSGVVDLNGLFLTTGTRVPIGTVQSFPDPQSVTDYFGGGSTEETFGNIYFAGFTNKTRSPGALLFAQYPANAVSGYLRGGAIGAALTLAQLQAITPGTLTIDFAGSPITSSSINLSGATSFSNAAALIEAAFTTPPFAVTYDSVSKAFIFTSTATGAAETIVFPSDTIATALYLTAAKGAVLSQGADAAAPGTFMDGVVKVTQDWATFTTLFNPDSGDAITNKLAFAAWTNGQNDRYCYVEWDSLAADIGTPPASASLAYAVSQAAYSGTNCNYDPSDGQLAAFVCGTVASIDFTQEGGRITTAFKSQAGLTPGITDSLSSSNAQANGYNAYGAYATANASWQFYYPGSVSGPFKWLDSYVNQIWLNNSFQVSLMDLLTTVNSIPYNAAGDSLIEAALSDDIAAALNAGVIQAGVTLSSTQIADVNQAAGANIAPTLQSRGWYLQVLTATASVRAARGTPPCNFWYTDGGSVQKISLASITLQ